MDWQLTLTAVAVAAAAAYVGRRAWKTWTRKGAGCGGGCGSACKGAAGASDGATRLIPLEQITVRPRRQ